MGKGPEWTFLKRYTNDQKTCKRMLQNAGRNAIQNHNEISLTSARMVVKNTTEEREPPEHTIGEEVN